MIRFHERRRDQATRDAVAETRLDAGNFIQPFFLSEEAGTLEAIPALRGTALASPDRLAEACAPYHAAGIQSFLLFGVHAPGSKDPLASQAAASDGLVCRGIRALKQAFPQAVVFSDICICASTDHGHCGILRRDDAGAWAIDNDATLPVLAAMALAHARAGADWVAPSAMMDGQVAAISQALDAGGFARDGERPCRILGYSAKFASAFYGPFRDAAQSSPAMGDRQSYQMDCRNGREALQEIDADLVEGADAAMVKPAMAYLDVLARARDAHPDLRLAAYHTSGEFMGLKAAGAAGVLDYPRALREHLLAMRRAGADWLISYAAADYFAIHCPWEDAPCHD